MSEPQVNGGPIEGGKYIDKIDPDDPEYQRAMRRPAEIKEDVRQMENRKRVSVILNSEAFREELEEIIESQIRSGPHPASLIALQQISELLLPNAKSSSGLSKGAFTGPVAPINDIRGVNSLNYTKPEKALRCKLASCYRLVDLYGWSQGIYNHITARISQDNEHFLINPFGLMYHEVSAASLLKIDMSGEVLDHGSTTLGINRTGFTIHSAIHAARPDIRAIIHIHTPAVVAISCMKDGLLPLSQEALLCGNISYHDYTGISVDTDDREAFGRALGPTNKILLMRNHGVLCCGSTIDEAFDYTVNLVAACETQIRLIPLGLDNITRVSEETRRKVMDQVAHGTSYCDMKSETGRKWRVGELEFEALMRMLDNAGYRTGFPYHQSVTRITGGKDKSSNDVEYPPAAASYGHPDDDATMSPLKLALERKKQHVRAEWLATPNKYTRTEVEETGTSHPKKITKWALEKEQENWELQQGDASGDATDADTTANTTASPSQKPVTTNTSIKVETKNQFAPQGGNPKELRDKQKSLRQDYYKDKVSAGPQSKILEGVTWDEAQKMKDGSLSATGDNIIIVGAASKGIIQREYQNDAVVYRTCYAANPFENMTDDDIKKYQTDVNKKQHGEPDIDVVDEVAVIELESAPEQNTLTVVSIDPWVNAAPAPPKAEIQYKVKVEPKKMVQQKPDETDVDEILIDKPTDPAKVSRPAVRSQSARGPSQNVQLVEELKARTLERSHSEKKETLLSGPDKPSSPAKSDTLRSTDSGRSLEEHSSREGSPVKEVSQDPSSPTKDKKKKNKFRMPSFSSKKKEKKK